MYDTKLIYLLQTRVAHERYIKHIRNFRLTKECAGIIDDISDFYKHYPDKDEFTWEEIKEWVHIHQHPTWSEEKHDIADAILNTAAGETPDGSLIDRVKELSLAEDIEEKVEEIKNKSNTLAVQDLHTILENFERDAKEQEDFFVEMEVKDLVQSVIKGHGIEWRLEDLNLSVGQVHDGDFIIIGKRPETGGTTFLTSEFTYMLDQLPAGKDAIIFNNEEGGSKIGLRVIQSALNVTSVEIESDPDGIATKYTAFLNGRKIHIFDKPGMNVMDIRRVLRDHPDCWLIGLNVLDKIGGFNKLDEIGRYRKLAEFARNLAKDYGAVFAVCQADAEAEGKRYLTQNNLYGSKTGVQGEADVMLMIGRDPTTPTLRYIAVAKNKKPTTGRMIPSARHLNFSCDFDEDRGRFTSHGSKP